MLNKIIFTLALTFLTTSTAFSESIKVIYGDNLEQGKLDAVGAVYSLDKSSRSLGTGTYIGDKTIVTAAHVIKAYLPKNTSRNGPVTVDLSAQHVYWTNDENFGKGDPVQMKYKVTKVVVDACFVNAGGAKAERPTLDMIRCDVALLKLDHQPTGIEGIKLVKDIDQYPSDALHVGYGDGEIPTPDSFDRKLRVQDITAYRAFDDWTVLLSNTRAQVGTELNRLSFSTAPLTGNRALNEEELSLTRAKVGDSGGPLLARDKDGDIRIIGILSAYSDEYNSFASLLIQKGSKHLQHPKITRMLSQLK